MKVEGLDSLATKLQAMSAGSKPVSVSVGYSQAYATFVHENLEAVHPVGQAKFLEQPARTMQNELADLVAHAAESGRSLRDGLLLAGLALQAASQRLCPVDTGTLRASAFTRVEES